MAGPGNKKRPMNGKTQRPVKRIKRKQKAYHSSESESGEEEQFNAVNLLDSDDDVHNAAAEDVGGSENDDASSADEVVTLAKAKMSLSVKKPTTEAPEKRTKKAKTIQKEEQDEVSAEDDSDLDVDDDDDDEDDEDDDDQDTGVGRRKPKSKRSDPNAFATSLSKILSTKLSTSKRADPVLARSAAAHQASKAAVDTALEARAKRHLREQKRMALDKGRVTDVLIATGPATGTTAAGEPEEVTTTADILETERRLRKVAQRGVVKLFNAVRAAQVQAVAADKDNRREGVIGHKGREEKVNEMSRKGFLELIASGGGGLKKGGLEEA